MTLGLQLTVTPANPAHGATITATYAVVGEPAPADLVVNGTAVVDGVSLAATSTTHLTNVEQFAAPTATGCTFTATADPHVWTATAP